MNTVDKPLLRALSGAKVDRHPFWLMRQAGRYLPEYRALRAEAGGFLDLCFNPDFATEVTLQPIRRFGMDAAIIFSDILLIPLALGQNLTFEAGEGPRLPPIRRESELKSWSATYDLAKLTPTYETLTRVRKALPETTALIGFAGAPWTVATYVVEGGPSRSFEHAKGWASEDPRGFGIMMDRLIEATVAHLSAQVEAGAEVLQLFDTWAGALSGEEFTRWAITPVRQIVERMKASYPAVPIIGFPKGIGECYLDYARDTGVDMVSVDMGVDLAFARDRLQPITAVQGNLDPELLVAGGEPFRTRVRENLAMLGQGRFVFNLGHGILQTTPPDHVAELAEIIRNTPV